MPNAAALRLQIEAALAPRIAGALTPRGRVVRDMAPTGVASLDNLLQGGLPVGAISEFVGPHSSGRTTLALAALAERTAGGMSVAWIDASDTLDPECAAAAGIDLAHLLWVRCQGRQAAQTAPQDHVSSSSTGGAALLVEGSSTAAPSGGCGSPHPRSEVRGLSEAVDAFLQADVFSRPAPPRDPAVSRRQKSMIGTPSAPNRKLLDRTPQDARPLPRRAQDREEQVPTDRQPSRRQQWNAAQQGRQPTLPQAQITHTAAVAANRRAPGAWTDNAGNAHGRSLATPPNAIAAGLPRFREMEARAAGQGHGLEQPRSSPRPTRAGLVFPNHSSPEQPSPPSSPNHFLSMQPAPGAPAPSEQSGPEHPARGPKAGAETASLAGAPPPALGRAASPVWQALDQALRATDLLLSSGGFSTVVLDLGDVPPEFAWRIPLATWFRFRAAADRARAVFILLTQHPCARSSAELVLRLAPAETQLASTVLTGLRFQIEVQRFRFEGSLSTPEPQPATEVTTRLHLVPSRKPPQSERAATWSQPSSWATPSAPPRTGCRP